MEKYLIASDHAGFEMKREVKKHLESRGFEVIDMGPSDSSRVDYPDYARKVACEVAKDSALKGVLICGTGIGISIAANKIAGVRAALCHDAYTASMSRAHNDANILCFGARVVGLGEMESIVNAFVDGEFEGGRHLDRVKKIEDCCAFI